MSTRSGKRRHTSVQKDFLKPLSPQNNVTISIMTRSKKNLDLIADENSTTPVISSVRRKNYVSHPRQSVEQSPQVDKEIRLTNDISLTRDTGDVVSQKKVKKNIENEKVLQSTERLTRSKKPVFKNLAGPNIITNDENTTEVSKKNKTKNSKLDKINFDCVTESDQENSEFPKNNQKKGKSRKCKNQQMKNLMDNDDKKLLDSQSNTPDTEKVMNSSLDSFHSAAGSPKHGTDFDKSLTECQNTKSKDNGININKHKLESKIHSDKRSLNAYTDIKDTVISKGDSVKKSQPDKNQECVLLNTENINPMDMDTQTEYTNSENTIDIKPSTAEKPLESVNSIFDKLEDNFDNDKHKKEVMNTTFDKEEIIQTNNKHITVTEIVNTTSDKENSGSSIKKTSNIAGNEAVTKENTQIETLDTDTSNKETANSTFDVETDFNDETVDKILNNSLLSKPDLNTTFDMTPEGKTPIKKKKMRKSLEISLFDTTPILIDSSMDEGSTPGAEALKSTSVCLVTPVQRVATRNSSVSVITPEQVTNLERDQLRTQNDTVTNPTLIFQSSDNSPEVNKNQTPSKSTNKITVTTPKLLRREGTFTKEESEMTKKETGNTPMKLRNSTPGSTPFHSRIRSTSKSSSILNLTHSIEKRLSHRRSSSADVRITRATRVMFCSPVMNTSVKDNTKNKVIKSSLKGSNKSFVFEESSPVIRPASRKRSFTHNDVDEMQAKKKKLDKDDLTNSINRLSKPRTPGTPTVTSPRSQTKPRSVRSKLPNFAALHKRNFDKMESLNEHQERKAKRALHLLTEVPRSPQVQNKDNQNTTSEEPKNPTAKAEKSTESKKVLIKTTDLKNLQPVTKSTELKNLQPVTKPTELKNLPAETKLKPVNKFGFKINTDFNPFSILSNNDKSKDNITRSKSQEISTRDIKNRMKTKERLNLTTSHIPKLNLQSSFVPIKPVQLNVLPESRKENAKEILTREKSAISLAQRRKKDSRNIIKGVRTNRRFELQMKMRNVNQ